MTFSSYSPSQGKRLTREQLLSLLRSAQTLEQDRFIRNACLTWLASYPGDLPINLIYTQTLLKAGRAEQALPVLQRICQADPEYLEAVQTLLLAGTTISKSSSKAKRRKKKTQNGNSSIGWALALGGDPESIQGEVTSKNFSEIKTVVAWSQALAKIRKSIQNDQAASAEKQIHKLLGQNDNNPLIAVTHLSIVKEQVARQQTRRETLLSLADYYHQRWPECIQCMLYLADTLMNGGEADQAVSLIHQAAAKDITGQVAQRLWGADHAYQALWPDQIDILFDIPIPAPVAAALGWNKLPEGEARSYPSPMEEASADAPSQVKARSPLNRSEPEELRSVREELDRLGARIKKPGLARADGRFPIYVIMTTRKGLQARYSSEAITTLETEMRRLADTVRQRKDWDALLFYADEGLCLRDKAYRLKRQPARYTDPWSLKLALVDLDTALARNGERIGAVLIVGGPSIVPFHRLPNPVDDDDDEVPSDNPYGTLDENYFIPEWPVGRLPDDGRNGKNQPGSLLKALGVLADQQAANQRKKATLPWYQRLLEGVLNWIKGRARIPVILKSSFGYSAAIWRQASISVFRPIGDPRSMRISPPAGTWPAGSNQREGTPLPAARLGYFNLHGLVDAVEWYGQRDPSDNGSNQPGSEPVDYPIAVQPDDITNSGRAPQIVFTEACYGAHILGRSVEESLALKFLQSGTQAVVGATSVAYGAISTPLIAADFLGQTFWSYIKSGFPAGEALRLAKISLAQEMHQRQGYLDGEDQKTLISFVLYGDPLAYFTGVEKKRKAVVRASQPSMTVKTVCDRNHEEPDAIPEDMFLFVKSVVEQYLPGMHDAQMHMSYEHIVCDEQGCKPAYQAHSNATKNNATIPASRPMRKVITLKKQFSGQRHQHRHYARLTLDNQGKLVKLVVSR